MTDEQYGDMSMLDLFRLEVDSQTRAMTDALLALEIDPRSAPHLESCMRGAHSLKGAARIVNLDSGVKIAHAMEDCLVSAQRGKLILTKAQVDLLLHGLDLLKQIADTPEDDSRQWSASSAAEADAFLLELEKSCSENVQPPGQPNITLPAVTPAEVPTEANASGGECRRRRPRVAPECRTPEPIP